MPGSLSRLAAAVLAVGLCTACFPGEPDPMVERCTEVIHYRHPSLENVKIVSVERDLQASAVTLEFEAKTQPDGQRVSNRIACDFESSERWTLESIQVGGRELTEAEVALVNSELLLNDLSRNPERLGGGPS